MLLIRRRSLVNSLARSSFDEKGEPSLINEMNRSRSLVTSGRYITTSSSRVEIGFAAAARARSHTACCHCF